MRVAIVLLLVFLLIPVGIALANEPVSPLNVEPITPQELVEKVNQVGDNVIELGQGMAPPAMMMAFIVAAGLIFIGLPLMMFTKKVFTSGICMLGAIFIMYVLVFHPESIIGTVKGIFNMGVDAVNPEIVNTEVIPEISEGGF